MMPSDSQASTTPRSSPTASQLPGPSLIRLATGLCVFGVLLFAALLVVALYRFRFAVTADALPWYAVALCGILTAVALLRGSPMARVTASLTGVAIAVGLLLAEVGIELVERAGFVRMQTQVARYTGTAFDSRSVREVVADLREHGVPAMPSVVPRVILPFVGSDVSPESEFTASFLPLAGVSLRPTVQLCAEGGQYPIFTTDEHGFLNPKGSWAASRDLVILIGDSFTHGYCVPADSNVAAFLRRVWPRVLNLGAGGSGPMIELATLTEYGAALEPRVVVWLYSENDLPDLGIERNNAILTRYLEPGFCQSLFRRQSEIDRALSDWTARLYAAKAEQQMWGIYTWRQTLTLTALRNRLSRSPAAGEGTANLSLFEQVLLRARDTVDGWGGQLVFVFLPAWERVFDAEVAANDRTRDAVLAVATNMGVPIVDLTTEFLSHADVASLFSRGGISSGHYSGAGYSLVATTLARRVQPLIDSLPSNDGSVRRAGSATSACVAELPVSQR
jgi:hypothetical protein